MTEIQALQNAANDLDIVIHERFQEDKRRTIKKYYATLNGKGISPSALDYDQMNHFLLGWRNAVKYVVNLKMQDQ